MITKQQIPGSVSKIVQTLEAAKFEAYLVGGCTRDLLLNRGPKDWDITTNAKPEEIMSLWNEDEAFYENDYGTVTIKNELNEDGSERDPGDTLRNIEITPYRLEASYSNNRHPDEVTWSETIEEDLKRRDFTINAIAYSPTQDKLVDLYGGVKDIENKTIRAVGNANERFGEDALRMMRAIRLSAEHNFVVEHETMQAITDQAETLSNIATERVRDEFDKILLSSSPMTAIEMASRMGIFKCIIPELEEGIGVEQNGDHIYPVWEHNLRAMQNGADKDWPLHVRLAALLHDVAKPHTRRRHETRDDWTFYGHEVVGARMAKKILERMRYPREVIDKVAKLVRWHMFFTDIDQITLSAVRRLVSNVGAENVEDLMKIRVCDRKGMGRPKEKPYRLRKYESMVDEAMRSPVSVSMLEISGDEVMPLTGEKPGPRIGWILHALLDEILEDPKLNTKEWLETKAKELSQLKDPELKAAGDKGKITRNEEEEKELAEIRTKHGVK